VAICAGDFEAMVAFAKHLC